MRLFRPPSRIKNVRDHSGNQQTDQHYNNRRHEPFQRFVVLNHQGVFDLKGAPLGLPSFSKT